MALKPKIVITPDHIFGIDNPKVIDNIVDKIEASVKNVVPDNHYGEAVYNEDVYDDFIVDEDTNIDGKEVKLGNNATSATSPAIIFYGAYVYADEEYYLNKIINIPIQYDTLHAVTELLLGFNKDGEKNIKYSCSGKIIKGTTNSSIGITAHTSAQMGGYIVDSWSSFALRPLSYYKQEETNGGFTIPTEYEKTVNSEASMMTSPISVTAHIDIPTKDNLGMVTATEVTIRQKKYLQLNLQDILCGIRISEVGGKGTALKNPDNTNFTGQISGGTYTQYVPEKVTITVYGNSIGIDLKEEIVKIGDGSHVFSFNGNELIQTTNNPTPNENYNKVIDEWKDGKELAELKLDIGDYYDTDGNLAISPNVPFTYDNPYKMELIKKVSPTRYYVTFTKEGVGEHFPQGDWIYYGNEIASIMGETPHEESEGDEISVTANGAISNLLDTKGELIVNYDTPPISNPLSFHIGDEVISYIFGANGKDKPMSLYSNGMPKAFKVIGKKMSNDGATFQKITVQQIKNDDMAVIEIGSILSGGSSLQLVNLEVVLVAGALKLDDKIYYKGEEATVIGEMENNHYSISCKTNGAFEQAMGQTIMVTIKSQ